MGFGLLGGHALDCNRRLGVLSDCSAGVQKGGMMEMVLLTYHDGDLDVVPFLLA